MSKNASDLLPINKRASCSILPGRDAVISTLTIQDQFTHAHSPDATNDAKAAAFFLSRGMFPTTEGFRHRKCPVCTSCVPIRIPLATFKESSELKRYRAKNENIKIVFGDGIPVFDDRSALAKDVIGLYRRYNESRFNTHAANHKNPRIYEETLQRHDRFFGMQARHILAFAPETHELVGCLIYHVAEQSAYGTMFFYEPSYRAQNIGHFLMLRFLDKAREDGIAHTYLGDWSREASGLSWKSKYAPMEAYIGNKWTPIGKPDIRAMRANTGSAFPKKRRLTL